MAMQTGMGLTKVIVLLGAGFTGSIVLRNGKLSDILSELQVLVNEKSKENPGSDSDLSEALASQVRRLAMEVRQLASSRSVTVISGGSGQAGNMTALIVPAATLGALGYGYMWWKGFSFSDLLYVTKRNMTTAVSNMTKHLEQVSTALAAAKRHLTQRIENLDGKLDEQKEISREIKNEVTDVRVNVSNIGLELNSLQELVWGLDGKMSAIEYKQKFTCDGVMYLCQFIQEREGKTINFGQDLPKLTNTCRYPRSKDSTSKGIALAIDSENYNKSSKEGILKDLEA